MLREIGHFLWHAPRVGRLAARLPQAALYDRLMEEADAAGLGPRRAALAAGLTGRVLELGCGTGRMFSHYGHAARVVGIEPDPAFLGRARGVVEKDALPYGLLAARGEALPFADNAFDAAVVALVLCSVSEPATVLAELRRVVRPGGTVRILEHVLSPRRIPAALMHAVNPLWRWMNDQGCNLNRRAAPVVEAAGFHIRDVERFQIFAPGIPAFPFELVNATRPAAE